MPDRDDNPVAPLASPGLGLGERLRSARKARALSVQQVADSLRLEEASVIALEDGRFEAMGAPVFVRGHLRRYAQLVGLPPDAVLEAYRAAAPGSDAPPSIARPREQADVVRVPAWVYWAAAAVILAVLAIALGGGDEPAPAPMPEPAAVAEPAAPDAAPAEAAPEPPAPAKDAQPTAEPPPAAAPAAPASAPAAPPGAVE